MTWATISEEERDGLNVALNEAAWAGISVDAPARRAGVLLEVLSLPADGAVGASSQVVLTVNQVSRIAASLRMGWWNDTTAQVTPLVLEDLDATVRSFGGCPIYGWEFIDPPEESWSNWRDRLSVDVRLSQDESPHVIDLFQEGGSGKAAPPRPAHLVHANPHHHLRGARHSGAGIHRLRSPLVGWPALWRPPHQRERHLPASRRIVPATPLGNCHHANGSR